MAAVFIASLSKTFYSIISSRFAFILYGFSAASSYFRTISCTFCSSVRPTIFSARIASSLKRWYACSSRYNLSLNICLFWQAIPGLSLASARTNLGLSVSPSTLEFGSRIDFTLKSRPSTNVNNVAEELTHAASS